MRTREDSRPQKLNRSKLIGGDVKQKLEALRTGARKEKMSNIFSSVTEVTESSVVCPSRVQPSMGVKFFAMGKPEEGSAARRFEVIPNERAKASSGKWEKANEYPTAVEYRTEGAPRTKRTSSEEGSSSIIVRDAWRVERSEAATAVRRG